MMNDVFVNRNIFWRILQQYSSYIVKIVVQIVLARLLLPEDFGLIAIVMVFVNIAEIIAISGFGTALIQKPDPDSKDYATALTSSLLLSAGVYLIVFFCAPLISQLYEDEKLTMVLRVFAIAIFIQSYFSVQNAFVAKKFHFKKSFIATLIATLLSGGVSIFAAYYGVGVWALVIQSLASPLLAIFALHILVPWVPRVGFDKQRFKQLFSFSWKVLLSSLIGAILEDLYNLVIGKIYGETMLGYYKQGNSYPSAILGQTKNAINAVILPVYATYQSDREALRMEVKKMTHLAVFLIFPMAFGLAAISKPFIVVVLTEKWLPCLFFLRLECIFYASLPLASSVVMAITATGKSGVALKIESAKLVATIVCILLLKTVSIEALCIARVAISVAATVACIFVSRKLLGYGFKDLIADIYKPFLVSLAMGAVVYAISYTNLPMVLILVLQIIAGIGIYLIGTILFMKEDIKAIALLLTHKREGETK